MAVAPPDRVRPPRATCRGASPSRAYSARRSRRQLPVPGVRRARPRPEARPGRRARRRAVRDGARARWSTRELAARQPATGSPAGRGRGVRLLRGDRLHAAGVGDLEPTARRRRTPARGPRVLRPPPGHDACRAGQRPAAATAFVRRFHADPARPGDRAAAAGAGAARRPIVRAAPGRETRGRRPSLPALAARRFRSPHTHGPHAQFLSNGRYTTRRHERRRRLQHLARPASSRAAAHDATCDAGGQFVYLRDVRCGAVLVAPPTSPRPRSRTGYRVTFLAEKASFRRRDDGIDTQLDIAVSTEDDVEVRRLAVTNRGDRPREIEVTSYAEIVLGPAADDLAHPAFGKLFVETEFLPERTALLCSRRPRARPTRRRCGPSTCSSVEGRSQGAARVGDRPRALPRPRPLDGRPASRSTAARCPAPPARARPDRQPAPARPPRAGRLRAPRLRDRHGARARHGVGARAEVPRRRAPAARTFALAFTHAQSALRHLGISSDDALLFERLASRVFYADRSLRAGPETLARNELGQEGLWPHGISGDLPILLRPRGRGGRPAARAPGAPGAGVLAPQGAAGRRRDPERAPGRLSRRDARRADGPARQRAVARPGATSPAARTCCAATGWARPSASCSRPSRGPC